MNYPEAIHLAKSWTKDHDVSLDGWRSVIAVLLERITVLEAELERSRIKDKEDKSSW